MKKQPFLVSVFIAFFCLHPLHAADLVKWVDAKGRVNYGTEAPPGAKVLPMDSGGSVSVVQGFEMPAKPPVSQQQIDDSTRRIEVLERQVARERSARIENELAQEEEKLQRARARADCEARHRTTCTEDGEPISKQYIVGPHHVRPQPPVVVVVPPPPPPDGGKPIVRPPPPPEPVIRPNKPTAVGFSAPSLRSGQKLDMPEKAP